jgi:hypothetical protein
MRGHITLCLHGLSGMEAAGSWIEAGLKVICSELTLFFTNYRTDKNDKNEGKNEAFLNKNCI